MEILKIIGMGKEFWFQLNQKKSQFPSKNDFHAPFKYCPLAKSQGK